MTTDMQIIDLRKLKPPGDMTGPKRLLMLPLLAPLSFCYGTAVRFWRRWPVTPADAGVPVISVGSIAVGGSGKTPVSMLIAKVLAAKPARVCIISRGYKRKGKASPQIVSDAAQLRVSVEEAGDEPYMMARRLPGVAVMVGRDRVRAAMEARRMVEPDVLVLDDGFQYRGISKQVEIVCLNWEVHKRGAALLPLGNLREGFSAIRPDHIAVIMVPDKDSQPDRALLERLSSRDVFTAYRGEPGLTDCEGNRMATGAADGNALLLSGIARPEAFEETCKRAGVAARVSIRYDDHHWYSDADAEAILRTMASTQCDRIVTTDKDVHKLPEALKRASIVLRTEIAITDAGGFWQVIERRLRL
jgi:tetraacyldisaccharide 4'-kinase